MAQEDVPNELSSLVEVKVVPKKNPSRWTRFFKWFKKVEKTPEAQYAKKKVKEYIETRVEGGIEAARNPGIANFKMQAEIENMVIVSQIAEDENRRKTSKFELELRAMELENQTKEAQIKKINAETRRLETDIDLQMLEALEKHGFKTSIDIRPDETPRLITIDERKGLKGLKNSISAKVGIKPLNEYIEQAKIPVVFGFSGRVVDVICKRIGNRPLAIDYVAEELSVDKRTFEKKLKEQKINYAQLRDQVRFHFSIEYLIHNSLSVEGISAALDFSDRSSFNNAFKRWTALSPATFRKLFRDYPS